MCRVIHPADQQALCLSPEGKFSCGIFIYLSFVSIDRRPNKFFNTNAAVLQEG